MLARRATSLIAQAQLVRREKGYWLAPERRANSLRALTSSMSLFAVALALFAAFALELTIRANLTSGALDEIPFLVGVGAFLAFSTGWAVWMVRRFR